MKLTRKLLGMFLVALGDFASGILIAHILMKITGYPDQISTAIGVYAIGATIAVLPDLDILIQIMIVSKKPEDIGKHRDLFHKPLVIMPIFALVYLFSPFWAYMTGLCLLAHFIHDSTGSGYGIKWLQPFSKNTFKFCTRRIICMWTPEEVAKNPFNPTLDQWLEEYYLKLSWEGSFGIVLSFITAIVIWVW